MEIWAHRGCSQLYPENTLTSFGKAMAISGLTGIELDIQLTKDGELVVIHDEKVDRTTEGYGFVKDFSLEDLKKLHIFTGIGKEPETIPTMREVLELLAPKLRKWNENRQSEGIRLNIELKTGVFSYPGIEEKIISLVDEMGVGKAIVYSSFCVESLVNIHALRPEAKIGILDEKVSNCLKKAVYLENLWDDVEEGSIALHPNGNSIDLSPEIIAGRKVRGWFGGHLYPETPTGTKMDLYKYAASGVTDVFINEPEKYL